MIFKLFTGGFLAGCLLAGALAIGAAALLPLSLAYAANTIQAATQNNVPSDDSVLNHIHHINQTEIHLANMALDNTQDAQVRSFANKMIKDHTAADQKTEQMAKAKNIALQSFQPSDQEKAAMDKMEGLKGSSFDTAYMEMMKTGHQKALHYLRNAARTTQDPELKSLIAELMPTVQHHERIAANIVTDQHVAERANQHEAAGRATE